MQVFSPRAVKRFTIPTPKSLISTVKFPLFSKISAKDISDLELETETVRALSGLDGVVIATGGGCVLRAENVRLLKSKGKIIYLKTLPETLLRRVGAGSGRPLLSGDAEGKLFRLYAERAPVYEAAADFTVETDGLSPEKITEILR